MSEKRVTTRELVRNFRKYKELLNSGKLQIVYIKVDGGELELSAPKKKGNGADIMKAIRAMPYPLKIKRNPKLFNDLIRTWH